MRGRLSIATLGTSIALSFVLVSLAAGSSSPGGSADWTFGDHGTVETQFGSWSYASSVKAVSGGRLLVAGGVSGRILLTRYLWNGKLDRSFGSGGFVATGLGRDHANGNALALGRSGKIVVAGGNWTKAFGGFALARYLPNGALDKTFGNGGTVTTDFGADPGSSAWASAVAIQPDGKIIALGSGGGNCFLLVRYKPDGSMDPGFGHGGVVGTHLPGGCGASALLLQPDGKIVAGGYDAGAWFALARYRRNGSLDRTFGDHGITDESFGGPTDYSYLSALALQPNGKIVAAGNIDHRPFQDTSNFAVARYLRNGSLDSSFAGNGWRELASWDGTRFGEPASPSRRTAASSLEATQRRIQPRVLISPLPAFAPMARLTGTSAEP